MLNHIDLLQVMVIDIETVPQYPSYNAVPEYSGLLWEQKTQYQRRDGQTAQEYYPRAGIWAEFGKVICISTGMFYEDDGILKLHISSFYAEDEKELLTQFAAALQKHPAKLTLCAHNGKEFDFPYLCRRMLINAMNIPVQLQLSGKKPWEITHLDTMELWKFGDYKNFTTLNLLASVFDIPTPKDDINGSDVYQVYWNEKNLERISRYCEKDVVTTAQVLLRFKCMPLIDQHLINYTR